MRSSWKLINLTDDFLRPSKFRITKNLFKKRVQFYDGKKMVSFIAKDYMLYKKACSHIFSKLTGGIIHVRKNKKKKNK